MKRLRASRCPALNGDDGQRKPVTTSEDGGQQKQQVNDQFPPEIHGTMLRLRQHERLPGNAFPSCWFPSVQATWIPGVCHVFERATLV